MGSEAHDKAPGDLLPKEDTVLSSAASFTQDFKPVKQICAHLNAFHAYANDPMRSVETNHYCSQLDDEVRQCILYDSPEPNARIIGIEYMITANRYESLPADERRLWHSHVYEVKSGMLVMPNRMVPKAAWELAEKREMEKIITLYGKAYHLWQTDRGDELPLGEPQLMMSYTSDGHLDFGRVEERDERFGTNYREKREARKSIASPKIHGDADSCWHAWRERGNKTPPSYNQK